MLKTALKSFTPQRVRQALEKIEEHAKLQLHRIAEFEPNVAFQFEKGRYQIKLVESGIELEECLRLRFEVFHREVLQKKRTFGVDIDKLDFSCDHLAIIDKNIGQIVGTYRLNCSRYTGQFYSASEFNMGKLLELPGHKLELGRACIRKDYRNGVVITLLWRGIAEYLQKTESNYMFGCASAKTTDTLEIAHIYHYLGEQNLIDQTYEVSPHKKFLVKKLGKVMQWIQDDPEEFSSEAALDLLPPLFTSYVKMGARFLGEPALDRDFRCIDFLTLLKMEDLNPLFIRKYKV